MLKIIAFLSLIIPAVQAVADTPSIWSVTQALDGREVFTTGKLASHGHGDSFSFHEQIDGQRFVGYIAKMAVDRMILSDVVERCRGDGCDVEISAELSVNGGFIELIIFEIEYLAPSATAAPSR